MRWAVRNEFQESVEEDNALEATKPQGKGLGLSISKMIVEDHGATHEFGGATFHVPLKRADAWTSRFDQTEKNHA